MRQASGPRFCTVGFVLLTLTAMSAGAGFEPGTECKELYFDLTLCNSAVTLLGCDFVEGSVKKICKCPNLPELPFGGIKVTISSEWDTDKGKCVSRTGSVCNIEEGVDNQFTLPGGGGPITVSSLDCKAGLVCQEQDGYPKGIGTCGSTGIVVFNGLIVGSVMILKMISIL